MSYTRITRTTRAPLSFQNERPHTQTVTTTDISDSTSSLIFTKLAQGIWFVTYVVGMILLLRFLFLFLGANMVGIVLYIYELSNVLVAPFQGIFPSPQTGSFFFDSASLLALLVYYLLALILVQGIALFLHPAEIEEYSL